MLFTKEDLTGEYQWSNGPAPSAFSGNPSRRLFNRYNGEQVLFIINHFATTDERFGLQDAHQLEKKIGNLPLEAKSEITVLQMLKETGHTVETPAG